MTHWTDLTHFPPHNPTVPEERLRAAMRHAESACEYLFQVHSHHFGEEPDWYTSTETNLREAQSQLVRALAEVEEVVDALVKRKP